MSYQNYFNIINKKFSTPHSIKDINKINITRSNSIKSIQLYKNTLHNIPLLHLDRKCITHAKIY